ncbi:AhpC/TSA family protein [Spirosoma sp. KCTC 42546]|uniref:TlpA disulfide reductase family protein n=1 Tax=Spirosoma sp. KCTC 42546 TaxID=2520506 RepID=UPI001159710C|nr:TlpA disulfide reductase family protein [Spirosoma sp. KCTC 42546]QDK79590.1 AhpC/TSA family protein [Spirosoma sp. KCTC 42546]
MRKLLTISLLTCISGCQIIAVSASFGQSIYKIKANIIGLGNRSVVVRYTRQGMFMNDTVKAHQGQFIHQMPVTDGNIATLVLNPSTQLSIWLDAPIISISGEFGPHTTLTCTGTPENNIMELYRDKVEKPYKLKKEGKSSAEADPIVLEEYQATRQFIKQHPATLTAAYLLYWQAMYDITIFDQLDKLLASLSPPVRSSYWAQKAITRLYNVRHRPRIGRKLPLFNLPDAKGKLVSLNSFKGKYVLLDFWGTWCIPCIQGIPELKAVHTKFGDRLAIVSIALERPTDRAKWLKAIDRYGMTWIQTAEFTSAKSGINELYNLVEYPTLLLADPKGILIAKIKYGERIEDKVQQLLDN